MAFSITSANAILMLAVTGVFSTPQQIQNFGPDEMFDTEDIDLAETAMSVDGKLSAGVVYYAVPQSITLAASSVSNSIFETWRAAMQASDVIFASGTLSIPSVGVKYAMTGGVLMHYPATPSAGKILKVRKWGLVWESVTPAPQ